MYIHKHIHCVCYWPADDDTLGSHLSDAAVYLQIHTRHNCTSKLAGTVVQTQPDEEQEGTQSTKVVEQTRHQTPWARQLEIITPDTSCHADSRTRCRELTDAMKDNSRIDVMIFLKNYEYLGMCGTGTKHDAAKTPTYFNLESELHSCRVLHCTLPVQ